MKLQNGKLKLEANDIRIGNFVFTLEKSHVKVQDIGGLFSHRVSLATPKGEMLHIFLRDNHENALRNYATVMYNLLGTVPDNQFLGELNGIIGACIERHKDIYGITEVSEEEDNEILEGTKEFLESVEEVTEKLKEYGD